MCRLLKSMQFHAKLSWLLQKLTQAALHSTRLLHVVFTGWPVCRSTALNMTAPTVTPLPVRPIHCGCQAVPAIRKKTLFREKPQSGRLRSPPMRFMAVSHLSLRLPVECGGCALLGSGSACFLGPHDKKCGAARWPGTDRPGMVPALDNTPARDCRDLTRTSSSPDRPVGPASGRVSATPSHHAVHSAPCSVFRS